MTRRIFALSLCAIPGIAQDVRARLVYKEIHAATATLHVRKQIDEDLVKRLREIEGVEEVLNIRRYSLTIERGEAYGWEELSPAILDAVRRYQEPNR